MELSVCFVCVVKVSVLLAIVNGAPVLARTIFVSRFAQSVDMGIYFTDGRPLLGTTKTWRGLIVASGCAACAAPLLGLSIFTALSVAALSMFGDLAASFFKRRLAIPESGHSRGLDTIPESLLPVICLYVELGLNTVGIMLVVFIFWLIVVTLSPVLFRLHIRKRPW